LKRTDGHGAFSILKEWLAPSSYIERKEGGISEGLREVWEGEVSLVVTINTVFGNKMVCTSNKMATTTVSSPVRPGRFDPHQLSRGVGKMGTPDYEGLVTHTVTVST
jgi:hypothetical protein